MVEYDIREQAPVRLAALPHRGAYQDIGRAFQEVAAIFSARGLWSQAGPMVGVYHSDPSSVAEADLRSHAGVQVDAAFEMPDVLEEVILPGGPHAVMLYVGPYAGLPAAWDALYGQALPASGRMPAEHASFEVYLNDPTTVAPEALQTEICVPLAQVQITGISDATSSAAIAQLKMRNRVGRFRRRRNCWPITVQVVVDMLPIAT